MDINKAITYVFEDDRWVTKGIIGLVLSFLSFLIIPLFFVQGYLVWIVRNVMNEDPTPLPEWEDWGEMFMDGLNLVIAVFVYALPSLLLVGCGFLLFLPAGMANGDVAEAMAVGGGLGFTLLSCLAALWGLALVVLTPAVTIQYAREDSLGACFRFSEVIAIAREQLGDIIIAVVVLLGIGLVLGLVGIIPIVGWLVALAASIYTTFVSGHLFGQIGRKVGGGKEKALDDPSIIS